MKNLILSNWNVLRIIRLLLGIAIVIQSSFNNETMLIVAGILFSALAIFNIGCCGAAGCAVPQNNLNKKTAKMLFMKKWISDYKLYIIGALAGALGGYMYWKYVGCLTGTCAITSDPTKSTLYFALMGALLFGIFKKEKTGTAKKES